MTLRGSDGQLHPRAPPKPLRVSAVFPYDTHPPPMDRNNDPSSLYDVLVVQVRQNIQHYNKERLHSCPSDAICKSPVDLMCPGAAVTAERSRGPTPCRGEVAEPRPTHRDFLWLPRLRQSLITAVVGQSASEKGIRGSRGSELSVSTGLCR